VAEKQERQLDIERKAEGTLRLLLAGEWKLGQELASADLVLAELARDKVTQVSFDTTRLGPWDSTLLVFLTRIFDACRRNSIGLDESGLKPGLRKLLALAAPENQRTGMGEVEPRRPFLERVADMTLRQVDGIQYVLSFIGDITLALLKMLRGRSEFRRVDLILTIQETGAQALPIVTLISLLIGMILAFIASIQLKLFGAQIFVANVVGIGVIRVMGAVMVGVIMAGRSGAAFAAQLGTMQVNEEIDALESLGLSPVEFLVLPRLLALTLMMPLLCLYADLMGILGGLIVGVGMLKLGTMEYINQTIAALKLTHFWVGLFHSFIFGILVAASGCLRGLQCERSASAVGYAATSAVVTAIVWMVVATLIITLMCQVLGV
jgi:phospholipid/cholesterol/gamma-HCH transport system permease protein